MSLDFFFHLLPGVSELFRLLVWLSLLLRKYNKSEVLPETTKVTGSVWQEEVAWSCSNKGVLQTAPRSLVFVLQHSTIRHIITAKKHPIILCSDSIYRVFSTGLQCPQYQKLLLFIWSVRKYEDALCGSFPCMPEGNIHTPTVACVLW